MSLFDFHTMIHRLQKFFRTPKAYLLILLTLLSMVALPGIGPGRVLPDLLLTMLVAAIIDIGLTWLNTGIWIFPSGALLSAWIVALVLSPQVPWYIQMTTAGFAICAKHIFRSYDRPIFNPAAFALLLSVLFYSSGESWWGGLAGEPVLLLPVLFACGILITNKVNKFPQVLAFFGTYFGLFTLAGFYVDPTRVAEVFRDPFLNAALFFGFFMLTDPPTSPGRDAEQIVFGIMVAVVSFIVFMTLNQLYFLLAGLLVGNAWVAWRHRQKMVAIKRARRTSPQIHPSSTVSSNR